nr:response regulator transcription factor [Evansella clarkii]
MKMYKVLVADDDDNIREIIKYYFMKHKMEVREAITGKGVLEVLKTFTPDVILLDVMMPELDGYDVCREVRKKSDVPIMMLTARDDEVDRVLGLELGADDYITKPFSLRELIARIKAIYRRMEPSAPEKARKREEYLYNNGSLKIDVNRREVIVKGEAVKLKPKEFDLLVHLAKAPGHVYSREALLEQVWGYEFIGDIRTVDVHIKKIRKMLKKYNNDVLETVWGVGYRFQEGL